jgi:D-beta-D-heptose 7-phosphate kinase/D-beta-D-heptose 1-phosphate adenosyltransferase
MMHTQRIPEKIFSRDELTRQVNRWKLLGKKIVFTNGCFDILHSGHLEVLSKAAEAGNILVVGLNSNESVSRLKGPHRPVNSEAFRTLMMASLQIVDAVSVFTEDTPLELISAILPDVLVKGGDYTPETIVGADLVTRHGGTVLVVPIVQGYSTTGIIERIRSL